MMAQYQPEEDEPGGHFVTAGLAVMGLGAFGFVAAVVLRLMNAELGFIDVRAMATTCIVFLVVGFAMFRSGRRDSES